MKPTTDWQISASVLATLVGALAGRPSDDGPDPDPHGPLGPISYRLQVRLVDRLAPVGLNPQPIPPGPPELVHMAAQELVDDLEHLETIAQVMPGEAAQAMRQNMSVRAKAFADECGTGALLIKLDELRRRLGRKGFPPGGGEPPPHPEERQIAIASLLAGAALYNAPALADLRQTGEQLMHDGLQKLAKLK